MFAKVKPKFLPLINSIQKMVLYETKARYYVVGSNNTETLFRVLKIDRTEPKQLVIEEDQTFYTKEEISDLLLMIDVGNQKKSGQKVSSSTSGLSVTCCAFGIVGFVKFLEGYYIILITKRRKVAVLGHHTIFKIEDTSMIYIPNELIKHSNPDEQRYLKIFQSVDLSSNFYFSYSYDLTHSLQYNCTQPRSFGDMDRADHKLEDTLANNSSFTAAQQPAEEKSLFGIRNSPCYKYVWNAFLVTEYEDSVDSDWLLYVIHGFVGQSMINIYGRHLYLTLIARRSNKFAGTRFLKRGTNWSGDVANEVETEQILHDASVQTFPSGHFTSFVQFRGSVPTFWSQDIAKMVPKPPIAVDLADPYSVAAGRHFNCIMKQYGSPIIVLNLVKKKENRRHECILQEGFCKTVDYLNQFLPVQHKIVYISFDMARVSKSKHANVIKRLDEIAASCFSKTGFFFNQHELYCNKLYSSHNNTCGGYKTSGFIKQTGVVRTNCVDNLDRTNTAQFVIGKCALAHQLYALGIIKRPSIEYETDAVRILEWLYEDHGDTLALQYGGSQLVRRIQTYRKASPWFTSQSRDIVQTLSRYYSNTFADADKQSAINLFLGVFRPTEKVTNLWDLYTDYYIHHPESLGQHTCLRNSYTAWCDFNVVRALPLPYSEETKGENDAKFKTCMLSKNSMQVDSFFEYYQPYQLTVFEEHWAFTLAKDSVPSTPVKENYSPFEVRDRRMINSGKVNAGVSSSFSSSSERSEASTSSSDDLTSSSEEFDIVAFPKKKSKSDLEIFSFKHHFGTMKDQYGTEIVEPDKMNMMLYRKHASFKRNAVYSDELLPLPGPTRVVKLIRKSAFSLDSSRHVTPPTVSRHSKDVYRVYITRGKLGATAPSHSAISLYEQYARKHKGTFFAS